MQAILDDFARNWYIYASMPVVAAIIGYVTKIVAIEMMFRPLEFVGKPPILGWQGIVPRRAARMASIACDTMTEKLISPAEIFDRLDAERVAKEIEKPLLIRYSGIYFGAGIGVLQMIAWALLKIPLIMPIAGLITGWFTDWLALKMIFNPKQPTRYLGLFEWQGLFLKRRKEVAAAYGALIAKEIITPHNIIEAVLTGPLSDKLFAMVQQEVQSILDQQAGLAKPLLVFAVGSSRYQEMKRVVSADIMAALPETMMYIEDYAEDAMDIRNVLVSKMQELSAEEFEALLRPAFEQDEWILITVGALLGFAVGELQSYVVVHFST